MPWHPFLVAAYPVLFLFGQNAVQQMSLAPLWPPLGGALAGAAVATGLGRVATGSWRRGALLASLGLALFMSFGHAWNLAGDVLGHRRWLVLGYLVVAAIGSWLITRRGRGWFAPATRGLNVVATIAVALSIVPIVEFATTARGAPTEASEVALDLDPDAIASRPDIYWIVLDRYPNAETLDRLYGFDNSPFIGALRERGFAIAEESWANYWKTAFSLLSTLRMEHLDGAELVDRDPPTFGPVHRGLQESVAATATLTSIGYEYVHLGNWWEPSSTNRDADRVLLWAENGEFTSAVLATTALSLLTPRAPSADAESVSDSTLARSHTTFAFERLEEARERPGPTYVFAHILVPHPPYVFDTDGTEPTADETAGRSEDEQMLRQLEWANGRVLAAIDRLTDVPADQQPVIVLQADEGPWPDRFWDDQREFPWLEATPDEIQEKFGILNAIRTPGVEPASLGFGARSSPVNTFRMLFNGYFGTDLPLLPDTTYLSPNYARMYDFVPYDRDAWAPREGP